MSQQPTRDDVLDYQRAAATASPDEIRKLDDELAVKFGGRGAAAIILAASESN